MRVIPFFLLAIIVIGCQSQPATTSGEIEVFTGNTMGTTYRVTIPAGEGNTNNLKKEADSLLVALNLSLSTYIDSSLISQLNFNTEASAPFKVDNHFAVVFTNAKAIHSATGGAFNPALGPLIRAWGFSAQEAPANPADNNMKDKIEGLLTQTNFSNFTFDDSSLEITKSQADAELNFSASAKGYGVDAVAELLDAHNISAYFVEIGGEVRTKSNHPARRPWGVGIDKPTESASENRELQVAIPLSGKAMATSGNYRNFYIKDGRKYVHTISPTTGYPTQGDILSASVIADDCMSADAFATAFMVMGKEKALTLVEQREDLEAFFVVLNEAGETVELKSSGFPEPLDLD